MTMPKEIIIIDPGLNTQSPLKTFLENEDYNALPVNRIEDAQRKFLEFGVSGLITDCWVNQSSTLEMARGIKKAFPEAYVVMLTHGEIRESEYEKIINAGVDDLFLKPFPVKRILLHLRKGLKLRQNLLQEKRLADHLQLNSIMMKYPG